MFFLSASLEEIHQGGSALLKMILHPDQLRSNCCPVLGSLLSVVHIIVEGYPVCSVLQVWQVWDSQHPFRLCGRHSVKGYCCSYQEHRNVPLQGHFWSTRSRTTVNKCLSIYARATRRERTQHRTSQYPGCCSLGSSKHGKPQPDKWALGSNAKSAFPNGKVLNCRVPAKIETKILNLLTLVHYW